MKLSQLFRIATFAAALLVGVFGVCEDLRAQAPPGAAARIERSVPATIVLVSNMGYGGVNAVLLRRPGNTSADVILLRAENATPEVLSEAVVGLLTIRKARGDEPTGDPQVLRLTATEPVRNLAWAATVLRRLGDAPSRDVQGVGTYRALEIRLPAQQMRD